MNKSLVLARLKIHCRQTQYSCIVLNNWPAKGIGVLQTTITHNQTQQSRLIPHTLVFTQPGSLHSCIGGVSPPSKDGYIASKGNSTFATYYNTELLVIYCLPGVIEGMPCAHGRVFAVRCVVASVCTARVVRHCVQLILTILPGT